MDALCSHPSRPRSLSHTQWALATSAALVALLSQVACGGKYDHSNDMPEGPGGSVGSTGGAVGVGARPEAGTAGGAGSEAGPSPPLDDLFPWFDRAGGILIPVAGRNETLHLLAIGTPARASTSTHNVVDMLSWARFVQFSARASSPASLLVSAGHLQFSYDYFAARNGDRPWPTTRVEVGNEWQAFSVPIAEMQPIEARVDTSPTFFVGFSVDQPEPVEVWIDDVRFSPVEAR